MQLEFGVNNKIHPEVVQITTHSEKKKEWTNIEKAILMHDEKIILIDARNDRKIPTSYESIVSIESEDRMCNVRLNDGKMLLLGLRLKKFEENNLKKSFIKINNSMMINMRYIKSFRAAENARIEVLMSDGSIYFVNRYYIKKFKENLV